MPANPVREKRDLLYIFGLPNPTELLVRVAISGEVQVIAQGPTSLDRVTVLLQPADGSNFQPRIYNLLEYAPIDWWRTSPTLLRAVENGWLYVDLSTSVVVPQPSQPEPDCCDLSIPRPPNPLTGDVLVWNGTEWTTLSPGLIGDVITSNGPLLLPSYQAGGGGGMLIGGGVTGGTVGSLLFIGPGPSLAQDNANLFWNDNTNRLGLGTTTPASLLSVGASSPFQINGSGNIIKLNNVTTSFPASQGAASTVLTNDGAGNLSWAAGGGGMAIGGSITSATAGSVLFAGAAGVLAQDNTNFFWDDTNNRLGIGTATPAFKVHVKESVNGAGARTVLMNPNTGTAAQVDLLLANSDPLSGVGAAYTSLLTFGTSYTTDGLFLANWSRLSSNSDSGGLLIGAEGTAQDIVFATSGHATINERMRILGTGDVKIINHVLLGDGSFGSPAYAFISSPTSGIYMISGEMVLRSGSGSQRNIRVVGDTVLFGSSTFVTIDHSNNRMTIGNASTDASLSINSIAATPTRRGTFISGTITPTASSAIGHYWSMTGAGSGAGTLYGVALEVLNGFTGGSSVADQVSNMSNATGTLDLRTSDITSASNYGNVGSWLIGDPSNSDGSAGSITGVVGHVFTTSTGTVATGAQRMIGVAGVAGAGGGYAGESTGKNCFALGTLGTAIQAKMTTSTTEKHVGVQGQALFGDINVGGFFGLMNTVPTYVSAALIADNGTEPSPIFIARDNGSEVFEIIDGGAVEMLNITAPATPAAGYGRLYGKTSDKHIYWKDDTGTEFDLTAGAGGLNGSIAVNQIAYGSGANTIAGSANFTWDAGNNLGFTASALLWTLNSTGNSDGTIRIQNSGAPSGDQVRIGYGHSSASASPAPGLFDAFIINDRGAADGGLAFGTNALLRGYFNHDGNFRVGGTGTSITARFEIDNEAVAQPIFIAKDNGTAKFTIADGGDVTMANGTFSGASQAVNAQTGTTYTLVQADNGKVVTLDNAAAVTVTVPSGLIAGFNCILVQLGAGQVTVAVSGTTVNNRQSHTKIAGQYGRTTLESYVADTFIFAGDTAA